MNVMQNFLKVIRLGEENDYYDENDEEYYDKGSAALKTAPIGKDDPSIEVPEEKLNKQSPFKPVTNISNHKKTISGAGMEVCVIKPNSFEEAKEITETLLTNRAVVLNLEGLDVEVAQRIIDFASGSCFAISGNLQKISKYIFIITPSSVDITGDFQEMITGSFNNTSFVHEGPQQIL
ncbi:cell division protein SepF [Butyrivibrio sp. MC2013]|uniref:cell division protein SepF n=1 Tax=Butyrivibrio sp. MC2013 TaxID=1280686 RepID=UPI00040B51D6|nr:cell division protein SepF [Butyrivibrio sp. MC2013]